MPCLQTAHDGRTRRASRPPSGTLHIQRARFYQVPFRGRHSGLKAGPPSSSSQSTRTPACLSERIWLMEWSPTYLGIHLNRGRISILWGVCVCVCVCVCARARSYVRLFVTPWAVNPPSSFLVCGILQARILEWFAVSYSRESSRPRTQTRVSCVSCAGRQIL